ncbi:MAG TPA: cobalamin-dependent protein [Solirubrobacterales bacterium]|nr:cobalamin-dependent protein [Solirubrobacterales bacterium]
MTEKSAGADHSTNPERGRPAARLSRLYLDALRANDAAGAYRVTSRAIAGGMPVPVLYQQVITPAMHAIGELWERGAITVADEHLATALTHRVLGALRSPIRCEVHVDAPGERSPQGRAMLATVEGEQHALGLRMVADVLEDLGFHAIYLGADVPTEALLQALDSLSPDLLALSVTMPHLSRTLEEVASEVRHSHPHLDLLVGGQAAPAEGVCGERETAVQDLELLSRDLVRQP